MISAATLARIEALRPLYQQVGAEVGLPWALLAAIDYRECDNNSNLSTLSGERIGTPNPDAKGVTTTSKLDSVQRAGRHLIEMAEMVYGVHLTANSVGSDIKLAALAYNRGFIYSWAGFGPDDCPYVVNQLDAAHTNMAWPMIQPGAGDRRNPGEPSLTRGRRETGRYGAYTLFVALTGTTPLSALPPLSWWFYGVRTKA